MSWSFSAIGKAAAIVTALQEESAKLTDQTKVEFDAALPHLCGLLKENFAGPDNVETAIDFEARGHGYALNGEQKYRTCTVSIRPTGKRFLA